MIDLLRGQVVSDINNSICDKFYTANKKLNYVKLVRQKVEEELETGFVRCQENEAMGRGRKLFVQL